MSNIANQVKNHEAKILESAKDLNYYGKRLLAVKMEICETLAVQVFGLLNDFETDEFISTVFDLLEANRATVAEAKPKAKTAKVQKVDNRPLTGGSVTEAERMRPVKDGRKFLITSMQNNTEIHAQFLANLEAYAEEINAELLTFEFFGLI